MSEELKPCPHYGSDDIDVTYTYVDGGLDYYAECTDCYCRGAWEPTAAKARAAWNSRPIEDKLQARIDALEWLREVEKTNRGMDEWHPDWKKRSKEANRRRSDARDAMRRMWWSAHEAVES